MAELPVFDRIAFAYALLETGLQMCPLEKSQDKDRIRCRAVRSLQSGLSTNNREIRALFGYFGADRAQIVWGSDCMAERAVWR